MKLIRGISGIRGIVGKNLTKPIITRHIQAFSALQGDGDILIGRDSRTHGESFVKTGCDALSQCGRNTFNYGIIPTPTAQFLVEKNNSLFLDDLYHNYEKYSYLEEIYDSNNHNFKNRIVVESFNNEIHYTTINKIIC